MNTRQTKLPAKNVTRIAFGVSAATVALLTLLPQTGWLVRKQLSGSIGGADSAAAVQQYLQTVTEPGLSPKLQEVAQTHPDNLGMQIAAAMQRGRESKDVPQSLQVVTDLWELRDRFGDDPVYCANYLRFACWAAPNIGRDWERDFISDNRAKADAEEAKRRESKTLRTSRWRDEPEFAAHALEIAKRGAQVDPENAFFPYMEAAIHLAQNRDEEALTAFHRAAACSHFRDYAVSEADGRIALQEAATGKQGMVSRTAAASTILFPHFSTLRAAAQVVTADAIGLEETGKTEQGFQIRHDLARVGALMRYDGSSGISNLVGIAVTSVAGNKPAGNDIARKASADSKIVTEEREALYCNYLTRTGHGDEASWFQQERQQGNTVRDLMNKSMDLSYWSLKPLATLVLWWCAGIVLLTNALWMLVGGAIAARFNRTQNQEATPLSNPSRLALRAAGSALAATLLCCLPLAAGGTDLNITVLLLTLLASGILAAPLLWLRRNPNGNRQEMSRDTRQQAWRQSRKAYLRTASLSLLVSASTLTIASHLYGQVQKTSLMFDVFTSGTSAGETGDTSRVPGQLFTFLAVVAVSLVAPLVTVLVAAICSRIKAYPASVGLARSFRRVALPLATLLLIAYSLVAVLTATQENLLSHEMDKAIAHEGRYGATLLQQPWPERVMEAKSQD